MKSIITAAVLSIGALTFTGCASSHEEGVRSNLRSQWTDVVANTNDTTNAAKTVLERRELKNVTGTSTMVDGTAMGMMADGTAVKVDIKKKSASMSEVSVTVGTLGSPTLGAEIAKAVKEQAEGMPR